MYQPGFFANNAPNAEQANVRTPQTQALTENQKEGLVQFMEKNKDLAKDDGTLATNNRWKQLKYHLMYVYDGNKTSKAWQNVWKKMYDEAVLKYFKLTLERPNKEEVMDMLTPLEKRIIAIAQSAPDATAQEPTASTSASGAGMQVPVEVMLDEDITEVLDNNVSRDSDSTPMRRVHGRVSRDRLEVDFVDVAREYVALEQRRFEFEQSRWKESQRCETQKLEVQREQLKLLRQWVEIAQNWSSQRRNQ